MNETTIGSAAITLQTAAKTSIIRKLTIDKKKTTKTKRDFQTFEKKLFDPRLISYNKLNFFTERFFYGKPQEKSYFKADFEKLTEIIDVHVISLILCRVKCMLSLYLTTCSEVDLEKSGYRFRHVDGQLNILFLVSSHVNKEFSYQTKFILFNTGS